MRIIKEIPTFYRSAKYIEPGTKLGNFLFELSKRINNEQEFISYISAIKFWDYNKASLWAFEDIINYIDELLEKYSNTINNEDINKNILLPLLNFLLILIKNNYNKDIFASFDNLQKLYLSTLDIKIKTLIIEINLLFIDNKRCWVHIFKRFYKTFPMFINFKNILIDLINNNFKINNSIYNILEEILINIHKRWNIILKQKKHKLSTQEQKQMNEILPFNLFKEIIHNKKNYKKKEQFKDKYSKEYLYFTEGYINRDKILQQISKKESIMKYLIRDELLYIINVNCFLSLINEIIECSNDNKNNNKILSLTKYILYALNLYIKDNQLCYDDEIVVSECYIECYYNDILKIITSPKNSIDLKSIFLKAGVTFMVTFDGYDNILFQNGLFHSFLNDLTHQNGNDMEVLTEKDSNNQEFLNIVLNFVFNFSIFKEIPLNFLSKILEIPKNNIYPYRIDNVIFSLKKKKVFDENIINQLIIPRLIYEIEHLTVSSSDLKYLFIDNKTHEITINERNNLIDRLYKILIRIIQNSTNLNNYGNFDQELSNVFKKILNDKKILENTEYTPSIINSIYFFIKLCNSFPSKIPNYLNNQVFNIIINYFIDYLPKYDGSIHLLFLMLYTICIHNDGKQYIKDNINKLRILFENTFNKLNNDENYFYYNLFILKDLNKYELYSPFHALIHLEGINELIEIIFENLKKFGEKIKNEITNINIEYRDNIQLSKTLFLFESKRNFINEFFISINTKDLEAFENNNIKIDFLSLIKLYFNILINDVSLYCLSSTYSIVNVIIVLAKKDPVYIMETLYEQFKNLKQSKNFLKLHEIQKNKIKSVFQRIFEFTFNKIYQKTKEKLDIKKYTMLFCELIIDTIETKTSLSCYISPINDRELVINSNYYCKFLSKKIKPQFRDLLIRVCYQSFCKDLPHTTNPNLIIIDEDNYKDLKYPMDYNQDFRVEILHDSYFHTELLNSENKINNYLLTSMDFFCSLGKMIKAKGLYDVKEEDVESVRNYMKLSYILKQLIKYIGNKYYLNESLNEDQVITHILIYLSLFNMLNILINCKNGKSISPLVIYYFIKYGGVREILAVAKNTLFFFKKEYTKGELPFIKLLILKNFWNLLVSLFLSIVKYSFISHNGYYTILIREGEFIKNFNIHNELDLYARYIILNDFIEIFFVNDDINYNISVLKDIEMNSSEFTKGIYILFDTCCRLYQVYKDNKNDDKINLNEIYNKGFKIYEIIQAIQEGKKTNEEIINHLNECKKIENEEKNKNNKIEKEKIDSNNNEKEKEKEKEEINNNENSNINNNGNENKSNNNNENNSNNNINNNNNVNNENNNNVNNSNNNNENNNNVDNANNNNENNNHIIIRVIQEGFVNEGEKKNETKKTNKILELIEKIPLYPDNTFIEDIKHIFSKDNIPIENKDKNNNFPFNKHRNELYPYSNENYIKLLNFISNIMNKSSTSYKEVNEMRKMNLEYRIKEFEDKNDLLLYLIELIDKINNIKSNNFSINEEEKLENILKYKKNINYSILRYKTLNKNFYSELNINAYKEFINNNKLIENALISIKTLINENKKIDNKKLLLKLIYENILTVYIIFCFLEHFKLNFEKEKKSFLETFLLLLKESHEEQKKSFINEPILILSLEIIIQFFNESDKSQELLNQFLNDNNLLKFILDLKFNPEDANVVFYENKFKYFVTIDECFKQFIHKIFSEKNLYEHLLESVFKYAIANIDCENNEINFDDFTDLCSDYIKTDNNDMFENVIKKLFIIEEKEIINNENVNENKKENNNDNNNKEKDDNANKKIYILKLREEYHKDIESIKNELNKYNHEEKNELKQKKNKPSFSLKKKDSHYSSKSKKMKGKILSDEIFKKFEKFWSERNKSLFYTLLRHIWKTSTLISEEITKNKTFSTFSRNFIIDLDSSLAGLNCILHIYPCYISLLLQFQNGKKHKISFIKYLIKYIFPILNYYHYCVSLPAHIRNNEELVNVTIKEKKDALRKYNNRANSFQSLFESFRYINIITSLIRSLTYKRRNMTNDEYLLINECRKKILNEINLILNDIANQKSNDFNFLIKIDELYPKNVVSYKSCIIILFAMTEFNDNSDIFNQFNPFEISNLIYSKEYNIIKNITVILKNMKIHEKNEIFHEMGIKYLSQLFQFIKINQKKLTNEKNKEKKGNINKDDNKDNDIKDMDIEEQQKIKNENDNNNDIKEEIKSNFGNDENSIGFSENSSQNNNEIVENVNEEISANEGEEEEEEEEEENEENEDLVDEEYDEDEEILPEQILAQNNAEEDLFSLMRSEEDDSLENEENEDINDIESFHLNNINFDLINNDELDEENNELNERENNFNPEEFINRLELALGLNPSQNNNNNNNQNQNEVNINNNNNNLVINNNQNYNEENILFYNPFIESASSMNKSQAKSEVNIFYEEFIIFPFLVLRTKSKNNLIYFNRPNISIDIFSNLDKSIVIKTSSMFLYNYLFPFDLNYERYFHFILIGAKEKTVKAYFEELNKIMKDFFSMYSMHDLTLIENSIKIIKKNLIENGNLVKTKIINKKEKEKEKDNKLEDFKDKNNELKKNNDNEIKNDDKNVKNKELLSEMPEELRENIDKQLNKDKSNNDKDKDKDSDKNKDKINIYTEEDNKDKDKDNLNISNNDKDKIEFNNEKDNKNDEKKNNKNENNEIDIQFIMDLPLDLREDILLSLDPSMIQNLSPELRNEYNRLVNKNNEVLVLDIPLYDSRNNQLNSFINDESGENDEIELFPRINKTEIKLKKLKYKKEEILLNYNNANVDTNSLIKIFDDEFIESLITFNIKTILTFKKKSNNSFNEYYELLNELIINDNLRYKIIDLILDTWICDTTCLINLLMSKKLPEKNKFLKNLYFLYIEKSLTEDYFFDDYERFFINFATKYPKDMKTYFLKTKYNDKGSYILEENNTKKEYTITENSKNIKEVLNIKYKTDENVLSNLISLTLLNNRSNIKAIFSIKIFTAVIKNCLKNINIDDTINNSDHNELNISRETIEKIIDLFNNFEATLYLSKGQRSNNPTSLLIEMINDKKIYKILLDVLIKRIENIKEKITKEMDDFFKNKKINIDVYNKLLPEIILFKLIKLLSNINDNFTNKINEIEKPGSKKKNKNNDKTISTDMQNKLKQFIKNINDKLFSCWEQLNNLLLDINNILKDSQDTLLPKLNRLIPYLETFIILSHLQFISSNANTTNNSENPFIFEKKFISGKDSPSHITFPLKSLNSKNEIDSFVEFFYEFCEKNKKIINFILRQYPKMFPNEIIIKISSILDLENKQKYFRHCLKKLPSSHKYLEIQVRRNSAELFSDSFASLAYRDAKDLRGKLKVIFENEEAVDAGGVKREWLTLLSKEMFNPNYMLFTLAKNGSTYTINSDSGKYNPDHLRHFEFIGKIMAKAIFDGMMIDCYFTRIIYKLICGTPISYHDMEDYDPVFYNSLKWVLENDFTNQETYLTYSYNHENLGEIQVVDLIENGRNIDVTELNKFDYVQKLCSSKLYDTIKLQIDALLKGFFEIIPQKLISIFNHRELELVISGMPTIDIKDWKNNTIYENYNEESNTIKNFWEIIESFDNDERAEFLQFVTGSSKVPLEGFSALQGIGGINKFKISKVFDKNFDRLPTAHTCTNQLELPDYPNKEILYERLTLAIREGKNSFGFV